MDRILLKQSAKMQLKGNIGVLFVCYLIYVSIGAICSAITAGFASLILIPPLVLGLYMIYLGIYNGNAARVETLFEGFKANFAKSIIAYILKNIFIFLWSILFVIPGIVKAYSYTMTFYILAENPEISANEAITQSRIMMHGHKLELFVIHLSFIPWILLGLFTCGIAFIYVVPYISLTEANFYKSISGGGYYQGTATEENNQSNGGAFYAE